VLISALGSGIGVKYNNLDPLRGGAVKFSESSKPKYRIAYLPRPANKSNLFKQLYRSNLSNNLAYSISNGVSSSSDSKTLGEYLQVAPTGA